MTGNNIKYSEKFAVVHGHFYQPPRENPWIDEIERQESAAPYHDWNQRIDRECYRSNGASRVLAPDGRIIDIINNYRYLSFNFGPTLMSWMEVHSPETYEKIIEADRISCEENNGHGNAIAQVYNHVIMPLQDRRDKITEIKWGIADFKYRFGRIPEAMWLAETAVDMETIECMIESGLKFLIVAPGQIAGIRKIGEEKWNTSPVEDDLFCRPFRIFQKDKDGNTETEKFIDAFVFNAGLSGAVGFEHLLRDAGGFTSRMLSEFRKKKGGPFFTSIATDGETFGHHEAFGNMCLASFFRDHASAAGIKIVNYASFLEMSPPEFEADLKNAFSGGTAWSCAHGTGRWKEDCGCSTGAREGWNQKWRSPLRNAFDFLKEKIDEIYEKDAPDLFGKSDIWDVRDQYVEVILDRSEKNVEEFFRRFAGPEQTEERKAKALSLLEMQRNRLLMYTSCAWFFADISGIETVQNMKYAARALQYAAVFNNNAKEIENGFLLHLSEAKSNIAGDDGKKIYERWVKPNSFSSEKAALIYVVSLLYSGEKKEDIFLRYHIKLSGKKEVRKELCRAVSGDLKIKSELDHFTTEFFFLCLEIKDRGLRFYCMPKSQKPDFNLDKIISGTADKIESRSADIFKQPPFTLRDIFDDKKYEIASMMLKRNMSEIRGSFDEVFEKSRELLDVYTSFGIEIPSEIKVPCESAVSEGLIRCVKAMKSGISETDIKIFERLLGIAEHYGLNISTRTDIELADAIAVNLDGIDSDSSFSLSRKIGRLLDSLSKNKVRMYLESAQNKMYEILTDSLNKRINEFVKAGSRDESEYAAITEILNLAHKMNFKVTEYLERIGLFRD
ncbi:MAG: DUF3536 domain-containing protein [Fibrobacterota bacterium]